MLRKFLFSALTNVLAEMNAKLCVGKAIPIDVLTYLKGKIEQLKQEHREAEKYFVLSGFTNSYHTELDTVKEELARQKEVLGTLIDMIAKRVIELQKRQLVTSDTEIQFTLTFNEIQKLLALAKPKESRPKDNWATPFSIFPLPNFFNQLVKLSSKASENVTIVRLFRGLRKIFVMSCSLLGLILL